MDNMNKQGAKIYTDYSQDLRMLYAKMIAVHNEELAFAGFDEKYLIGFKYNEYWVINPFIKAGTTNVECDPIEEYGSSFVMSPFFTPQYYYDKNYRKEEEVF